MFAALSLLTIPALCLLAPILIGAGAVGGLGFILAAANNAWVSAIAVLVALGVAAWLVRRWLNLRRKKRSAADRSAETSLFF
jgi:membrane protein implicated in regulation of membrane protease activity